MADFATLVGRDFSPARTQADPEAGLKPRPTYGVVLAYEGAHQTPSVGSGNLLKP